MQEAAIPRQVALEICESIKKEKAKRIFSQCWGCSRSPRATSRRCAQGAVRTTGAALSSTDNSTERPDDLRSDPARHSSILLVISSKTGMFLSGRYEQNLTGSTASGGFTPFRSISPRDEKEVEFDHAANGIVGLETALSLTLRLVKDGVLSLAEAVRKLTVNPARILGLPYGTLSVGAPADVVIFDPTPTWTVTPELLRSKSKNTPFSGWELSGKVVLTMVAGRVVYEGE